MQNVKQEWFSIPELLAIIHRLQRDEQPLPIKIFTDKGLSKKADRENWQKRQRSGVKGKTFEYYYSSFPIELQKELGFSPIVPHQEENKNNLLVADKTIKKEYQNLLKKFVILQDLVPYKSQLVMAMIMMLQVVQILMYLFQKIYFRNSGCQKKMGSFFGRMEIACFQLLMMKTCY